MKIGFLVTYFYPFKDGTENNCLFLARELVKLGHEVHVFTSDRRNKTVIENKEEVYDGICIHRCKTIFRYKYYLVFDIDLITKLMKYDLDVLHVHSLGFPQQDLAVLIRKLFTKTKIVNTPHGPFLGNTSKSHYNILRNLYRIIELPINLLYDAAIQVNSEQWRWLVKYGFKKSKIYYVPDGIPAATFRKISNQSFREKHDLNNKIVISCLGRLVKYKGQEQIIKVLPNLIKKNPEIVLLIMGRDAGYGVQLKILAKKLGVTDYVIFTGEVSDVEKLQGLETSEIFVFPSEPGTEAFGIVTLEAMARGNAAISTKIENGHPLIKHGYNGFLYDYGNLNALENCLSKLIENKTIRTKFSKRNCAISKAFINENIAKKLEQLYKDLDEKSIIKVSK
jgi:glycosyltransferase involved in cell wall biosynthesis